MDVGARVGSYERAPRVRWAAAIFVSWYATTRTLKKSDDQLALDTASFQATLQPIVVETTEAPGDISIMKHMDDGRYEVRGT